MMRFEGRFTVPAAPADVLAAFEDIERMVGCMPGASIDGRDDEGNWLGSMLVSFGPKKIRFKGRCEAQSTRAASRGTLHVRGGADMRTPAPAQVQVEYTVVPHSDGAAPSSEVVLVSEAEIGGVLADFAQTGGVAVTQALMDMFAANLARELARPETATNAEPPQDAQALSSGKLLWTVVKNKLR